jgi:glycosyltransferase involved in cell wall biosynthesis
VRLVRTWRPDVVHLHSFWLWPVARTIREQTGAPLVYTVHSLDRAEYELGGGPPECLSQWATQEDVIAAADRVVALTESERALLCRYHPAAGARVRTVGNGIADGAAARRAARRRARNRDRPGDAPEAPVVLFTGRFVARKGVGELLEAIPRVLDQAPETRFVLAGGHRHLDEASAERLWLPAALRERRDRVRFTGWLTPAELAAWYAAADVLVVPSWYEPFGMVVLEGMLHGLAVAAAAVGGPAEILDQGRTGLLFPPRDAGALARTILRLVGDPPLRGRLGLAAAHEVRRRWLWPQVVEQMRRVYLEAAACGPRRTALALAGGRRDD